MSVTAGSSTPQQGGSMRQWACSLNEFATVTHSSFARFVDFDRLPAQSEPQSISGRGGHLRHRSFEEANEWRHCNRRHFPSRCRCHPTRSRQEKEEKRKEKPTPMQVTGPARICPTHHKDIKSNRMLNDATGWAHAPLALACLSGTARVTHTVSWAGVSGRECVSPALVPRNCPSSQTTFAVH